MSGGGEGSLKSRTFDRDMEDNGGGGMDLGKLNYLKRKQMKQR